MAANATPRSREEAELDAMIRDAFRAWLSFGRFTKWLVLGLAKLAAGIAAYEFLVGRIRSWLSGGG